MVFYLNKFCTQCGKEVSEDANFCDKCGNSFDSSVSNQQNSNQENSNFQPNQPKGPCVKCGSLTSYNSNICDACGEVNPHRPKESHTAAIVLGYIFSFLSPLIGIIFAIYLLTRENEDVKKHGIIQLVIAIIIGIIFISLYLSWLSYLNSYSYYNGYY